MKPAAKRPLAATKKPTRVLGRGLGAKRGVHLTLRTLRDAAGKTQEQVCTESGIDQADISRLECRELLDDYQVSTLRRYLATLGGGLELVASFADKRIVIVGAPPPAVSKKPAKKTAKHATRKTARRSGLQ